MPRLAAVTLALVLLAGCGGGRSDEDAVRETVSAFGQATAEKDFDRLCGELFAEELVASLREIGLPCPLALERSLGEVEDPELRIGEIRVDGDRAQADVRTSARGQAPSSDTLALVRVEDSWRIADLDSPPARAPEPNP